MLDSALLNSLYYEPPSLEEEFKNSEPQMQKKANRTL